MKRPDRKRPDRCLNCDEPLAGDFCAHCGQKATDLNVPFRQLVGELLGDLVAFDSRMLRTMRPFLTRPGHLANEYNAGRRVRYTPPFRLYIFFSFVAFLTATFADVKMVKNVEVRGPSPPAAEEPAPVEPAADEVPAETSTPPSFWDDLGDKIEQNPERLNDIFIQRFAQVLFVFVPIFALLLKLLYVRRKILYIRHLTFSAYYHAFVFFVMWAHLSIAIVFGIPEESRQWLGLAAFLLIAGHLFLSLRRVYGQTRLKTFVKMAFLGVSYMLLLLVGMLVTVFISARAL